MPCAPGIRFVECVGMRYARLLLEEVAHDFSEPSARHRQTLGQIIYLPVDCVARHEAVLGIECADPESGWVERRFGFLHRECFVRDSETPKLEVDRSEEHTSELQSQFHLV